MAQWYAIGLTAVLGLIGFWWRSLEDAKARNAQAVREAEARALQDAKISYMKGEIILLQNQSQTEGERDAIARNYDIQRLAHEREDNLRFANVIEAIASLHKGIDGINGKMDKILEAVNGNGNGKKA